MRQAVDAQLCRAIIGLADISDHPGRRREQCIGSILLLAEKLDRSPADVERTMKMDVNNGFPVFDLHLVEHRSEEHTSELQSLMRISYAVFCLKKKKTILI